MRTFIITLALFFAIISMIAINSIYVRNITNTIIYYASDEEFNKAPEVALEHLESFWNENKLFLEFSVSFRETDRMSEYIIDLRECIKSENAVEAKRIRTLIADCASDISRLERLSLENLL